MENVVDINGYTSDKPTCIALGTFDGVHSGHRAVISAAVTAAADEMTPAVFTFDRSPAGLLGGQLIRALTTQSIKRELLCSLGVQLFISPDFSAVRNMSPLEFLTMLRDRFNAKCVFCGFNFSFGKQGEGNAAMLLELCKSLHISGSVLPPVTDADGLPVSSTRIREYIASGDIVRANELLGEPFGYDFTVVQGDRRGRQLNFPTINQKLEQNFVAPKFGVYASKTLINGDWYRSITNVGVRPTVGSDFVGSETYIFDYSGVLYGEQPWVRLFRYIRPEQHFTGLEALRDAIEKDITLVKALKY